MTTIVTRSGKGSPLTAIEHDANLNNLNNDKAELNVANEWTATQNFNMTTLGGTSPVEWDVSANQVCNISLAVGSLTLAAPTNINNGGIYTIYVNQSFSGINTLTWDALYLWGGGTAPTITTSSEATDIFMFLGIGNSLYEISRSQDVK